MELNFTSLVAMTTDLSYRSSYVEIRKYKLACLFKLSFGTGVHSFLLYFSGATVIT